MAFEAAAPRGSETPEGPERINQLLGHPSVALGLKDKIAYPVEMTREKLNGTVMSGPHTLRTPEELEEFCKSGIAEEKKGMRNDWMKP